MRAGRLNCAGISRLYLSSTQDIAAAEVRAITGDFVTIAKFVLRAPITVFDFRNIEERAQNDFRPLLGYVRRIISVPVFGYDNYECVLAQWITEYMENSGVHAVIFPSVMRGKAKEDKTHVHHILNLPERKFFNVCAFYPDEFSLLKGSPCVVKVGEVTVSALTDRMYAQLRALDEIQAHPETILSKIRNAP